MIGETTTTGDVAPVMTGAPVLSNPSATAAKRRIPTGKPKNNEKKKKLSNLPKAAAVAEDGRDGFVIPNDAKEIEAVEVNSDGLTNVDKPELPGEKIKNPYSGEEPLILPAASLVAPDVTPRGISPLDPSQLPGADRGVPPSAGTPSAAPASKGAESPVVDLMLGKKPGAEVSAESAMSQLPGVMAPSQYAAQDQSEEAGSTGSLGEAMLRQGQDMPEHRHGNGVKSIMSAFSRFIPRGQITSRE